MCVSYITADILGSEAVIMPSVMLKDILTGVCGDGDQAPCCLFLNNGSCTVYTV